MFPGIWGNFYFSLVTYKSPSNLKRTQQANIQLENKLIIKGKWIFYHQIYLTYLETQCFLCGSAGKESTCNARNLGSIPWLGRSRGEGKGYVLQYSGLDNSMDSIVHGFAKSWTGLRDFHFHFSETSQGKRKWFIIQTFNCIMKYYNI